MAKGVDVLTIKTTIAVTPPVQFALEKLKTVVGETAIVLHLSYDKNIEKQGYCRAYLEDGIHLSGAEEAGLMYGVLDLYDSFRKMESPHGCVGENRDVKVTPYMENRGIKFNIPLDSRTPSYSDASTSAAENILNMWDMSFWTEFLDHMAENKYNVLSLWSLSPFPSLVKIPEYPLTALDDVKMTTRPFHANLSGAGIYGEDHRHSLVTLKKITMDEKILFWQEVMQYAKDRCVRIFLFTWNLFVYGTEASPYGITESQENPVTKDYVYCGTKALMETYPLLSGIGVTAGENMTFNGKSTDSEKDFSATDVGFIAESYGRGVKDYLKEHPKRRFTIIHRMQMARYQEIMNAFADFPCKFEISFKYSQAHMYANTKPSFIRDFLREKDPQVKIWLTVRNDDFYMYRWGDPEFAREYLQNMPKETMTGFYMGADGFTWGRDYMDIRNREHVQFVDKMWYMFKIWGQLSYNLSLQQDYFIDELKARFRPEKPDELYGCWQEASRVIQELNCVHWHDFDFQWYPEGCCMYEPAPMDKICFADINEFVSCSSAPGSSYESVEEYCRNCEEVNPQASLTRKEEASPQKISPLAMADSIRNHAAAAEKQLKTLRGAGTLTEYEDTLNDIEALCTLGHYYSLKIKAAVALGKYRISDKIEFQKEAVSLLREAAGRWKKYSAKSKSMYRPQVLTRLCGMVDVQEFDRLAELDVLLAEEN